MAGWLAGWLAAVDGRENANTRMTAPAFNTPVPKRMNKTEVGIDG